MEWSNQAIFKFLDEFQMEPCIWDVTHPLHKNRNEVSDAWNRIKTKLNWPCDVPELKKKKDSLMASFRMLLKKKQNSKKSGADINDAYEPSWFAYKKMESFLAPTFQCARIVNTEETEIEQPLEPEVVLETESSINEEPNLGDSCPQYPVDNQLSSEDKIKRKRISKSKSNEDQKYEAFELLVEANSKNTKEDECDLYGKLIAHKLRKFSDLDRQILMHEIDGILLRKQIEIASLPEVKSNAEH